VGFDFTILVEIATDSIGSCKSKLPYDHEHDSPDHGWELIPALVKTCYNIHTFCSDRSSDYHGINVFKKTSPTMLYRYFIKV